MMIQARPPGWFWLVAIALLAWNMIGLLALLFDPVTGIGDVSKLPPDQQWLYATRPAYGFIGLIVATVSGTLGCILLLMRRNAARWLFLLSLLGFLVQNSWLFIKPNARAMLTGGDVVLMLAVLLSIGLALSLTATAKRRRWSR